MIFILNKHEVVINFLKNGGNGANPFYDDLLVEDLVTGAETFTFSTIAKGNLSKDLVVGNFIAFKKDGKYKLFQIMQVTSVHEEEMEITVYCECAGLSLTNKVYRARKIPSATFRKFLESVVEDTDWNVGLIDVRLTDTLDLDLEDSTAYSTLQNNLANYGVEIEFRVEITNGNVTKKYIDAFVERGKKTGKTFRFGSDIEGITKTIDSTNLCTALIGKGRDGITFKDVTVSGIDKPVGQDFVADQKSYELYNRNGYHLTGIFEFDTESPEELLRETYKELQKVKEPQATYDVQVALLGHLLDREWEKVSIGDYIGITDMAFNPPLMLMARVSKLETSFTNPQDDKCTLTNFVEVSSNISDSMRKIASELEGYVESKFPVGSEDIQEGAVNGTHMDNKYMSQVTADIVKASLVEAEKVVANEIQASEGRFENLVTDKITATEGKFNEIITEKIEAIDAEFKTVNAEIINTNKIVAELGEFDTVIANKVEAVEGNFSQLKADVVEANRVIANKVEAVEGEFDSIKATVGEIDTVISGNISSENIQTGGITGDNLNMDTIFVSDANIIDLKADKIISGKVNTNKVTIESENGGIVIADNTQQFKDKNGKVRVQIGQDATGDFNFGVFDETGTGVLIDATGVKEKALADGIIKDRMINEGEIGGNKIDINSLITEVNKDTNTTSIKGSKVLLDTEGQKLDVAFNSLKTNVNNIQVGGRNLVLDSKLRVTSGATFARGYKISDYMPETQNTYTISFRYKANKTIGAGIGFGYKEYYYDGKYFLLPPMDISKEYYEATVTLTRGDYPYICFYTNTATEIYDFKIEKGTKATSYTEAPEDTDSKIESNTTAISVAQGKIDTLIKDTTIEKDGQTLKLKDEYSKLEQTVSGLKTTVGQQTTTITEIGKKVDNAESVANSANDKVDNLQIGGRNLLKLSSFNVPSYETSLIKNSQGVVNIAFGVGNDLYESGEYIISFLIKSKFTNGRGASSVRLSQADENSNSFSSIAYIGRGRTESDSWSKFVYNLTLTNKKRLGLQIYNHEFLDGFDSEVYVKDIKIEKGTKATDWTPAPEDIDNSIDKISEKVTTVENKQSSLEQNLDGFKTTVSNTYSTKSEVSGVDGKVNSLTSRVSTAESGITQLNNKIALKVEASDVTEAINGIQIGARNLIRTSYIVNRGCTTFSYDKNTNTWTCVAPSGSNAWGYGFTISSGNKIPVERGKTFIVSLEVNPSVDCTWNNDVNNSFSGNTGGNDNDNTSLRKNSSRNLKANVWTKCWFSYTAKSDTTYDLYDASSNWGIVTTSLSSAVSFKIRNIKGEYGNKPTDWTPAPEDVDSSISNAQTNAVNSAKSYTDGQISTVNQTITNKVAEIKLTTDSITQRVSSTESTINNLQIGVRNFLINSDFKNTTTTSGTTNKNPNLYPLHWGGYNGGISNPTTNYHAHIDNTTFGYNVVEYNESDGTRHWKGISQELMGRVSQFDNYTISFDAYATLSGAKIYGGFYYYKTGATSPSFASGQFSISSTISVGKWGRCSAKVPLNNDVDFSKSIKLYIYGYGFSSNAICYIKNVKLEVGNKASDWSPAPEDVDSAIATTNNKVATIETNLNGITSRVSSTESNINTINGNITNLTSRMNSAEQKITSDAIVSTVTSSSKWSTLNSTATTANNTANSAKSTADSALSTVNNLQIGGRNYIVTDKIGTYAPYNTITSKSSGYIKSTWNSSSTINYFTISISGFTPKKGVYTVSGTIKVNSAIPSSKYFTGYASTYGSGLLVNEYDSTTGKFIITQSYSGSSSWIFHAPTTRKSGSSDVVELFNLKFEEGNKATDWTPAPEDMETRMSSAEQKITASAILNSVNTQIGAGGQINTVSTILDKTGFTVKNGAIKIQNNAGTNVLSGDTSGNLLLNGGNLKIQNARGSVMDIAQFHGGSSGPSLSFTSGSSSNNSVSIGLNINDVNKMNIWADSLALSGITTGSTSVSAGNITANGNLTATGAVYASNWFRTYGNSGWYSQTYGGGWYMQDSTWIRNYGSKNVYINTVLRADGGLQVGDAGSKFSVTSAGAITAYGEHKFSNGTYSDPWSGTVCAIKATGNIATTGHLKARGGNLYLGGASNASWVGFYDTTGNRKAYVGKGSTVSDDLYIAAESSKYVLSIGHLCPSSNRTYWVGTNSPAYQWKGLCAEGGTVGASDIRSKENIERLDGTIVTYDEIAEEVKEYQLATFRTNTRATGADYYEFIKDRFKPSYYNYKLTEHTNDETGDYVIDPESEYNMLKNVGFIAQDYDIKTDKVAQEFIFANEAGELSYNHMSYVTVGMIALQQATRKIEALENENKQLKKDLKEIKEYLGLI